MAASSTILYYSDARGTGGAERYLTTIARGAADAGHRVEVAMADLAALDPWAEALGRDAVTVHRLPVIASLRRPGAFLRQFRFFLFHRYALVHFNQVDPWSCSAGILAAKLTGLPNLISTSHLPNTVYEVRTPFRARVAPYLLKRRILVGQCHLQALQKASGRSDPRLVVVVNGIPLPDAASDAGRRAARRDLDVPEAAAVVGTVGRLTAQKNQASAIEAMASVPDALLVIIGDGPERDSLERLATRLAVADRVRFAGERPDGARLLPAFDVFVMPSRYEGLPLALLEAMGAGLPVVASDLPEIRDVIRPGQDGLLAPSGDATSLAEAVRSLLGDADRRTELGRAARRRVIEAFDEDRMKRETLEVYAEVLG